MLCFLPPHKCHLSSEIFLKPSFLHEKSLPFAPSPHNILHKNEPYSGFSTPWSRGVEQIPTLQACVPMFFTSNDMPPGYVCHEHVKGQLRAWCLIHHYCLYFCLLWAWRVEMVPNSLLGWGDPGSLVLKTLSSDSDVQLHLGTKA